MIAKPKRAFPSTAGEKFPVEVLTADEMKAILGKCSRRAPTGIRNKALIVLLYRGALRISEALSLLPKDITATEDGGVVRVLRGKGGKARTVGIDPFAMAVIDRWLETRKRLGFNGRQRVFCTLKGDQVNSVYVRQMLKRIGGKVGIDKRMHPHALRHTCAFEMMQEGIPIGTISAHLGHASIATTSRYLAHLNPADVIDQVQAREWSE